MARVLEMTFNTENGNSKTMRVIDAKETLDSTQVTAAMDTIIAKNIFSSTGGVLIGKIKAQIVTTTASEIELD